jgi:xylulokinase
VALDLASGEILASASQAYGLIEGLPPGHLEQEPQKWLDAVDATVREVLKKLGKRRDEVKAIGVSGQQHGFVPLDKKNKVIRPAKLWCDTSTTEQCEEFEEEFGGASDLIELSRQWPCCRATPRPKILWLKQNEPKNYKALATVLLPHDYINFTSPANAAWNTATPPARPCSMSAPANGANRSSSSSTRISPAPPAARPAPAAPSGLLRENLRERWGLSKANVTVSAGGGDNMMGAIGTGNVAPGRVTASLGTSGTIYAYSEKPVIDPQGEVAGFCDSTDAWLPLVCTMNVTVATEPRGICSAGRTRNWRKPSAAPPGADGLLFLPYLQGERTPNLPRGTGVFHGLTTRTMTPAHLARATMEGVTLGLAYGCTGCATLGIRPRKSGSPAAAARAPSGGKSAPISSACRPS